MLWSEQIALVKEGMFGGWKMDAATRLLPLVKLEGIEYAVDIEYRRIIPLKNPGCAIDMHSREGRRLVLEMQGVRWQAFVVEPTREQLLEV